MPKKQKTAKITRKKSDDAAVTVLLTGFDAFGGDKHNPSQLVVESFPDILKSKPRGHSKSAKEIHIRRQILPTEGMKGWKTLKKALDDTVKQAAGRIFVVLLGQAASCEALNIERFAMNFRDYPIKDNASQLRVDETIEPKAPQLLRTNLNLPKLSEVMCEAGYPTKVSNHAGSFICNEMYFRALNYKRELGENNIDSVLFVHLPLEKTFAKTAKKARSRSTPDEVLENLKGLVKADRERQINFISDAIVEIIENIAQDNVDYPGLRKSKLGKK